uniref:Uncharacterized protein n=1 Tax=Anguilla anguilla TaxID=7936 RepID=A0A0E9QLE6_ANGAN
MAVQIFLFMCVDLFSS